MAAAAQAAPPDLTPISGQSVREGATLGIPISAPDPDGDGVTLEATGLPSFCSLTDNGDATGSIDCSPLAGDSGNSNITVTATDDSLAAESASDNFLLTVEANTAPNIANISNRTMAEGESLSIPASASDGDGDGLSFTASGLPAFCSLTDNTDGTASIACSPGAGTAGVYNPITITVTDDAPIPLTDFDLFSLTVTANTAPVLTLIADQGVAEGGSLAIPLSATDPDGDGLVFSETGLPAFCILTDNGNGTGNIACNPGAGTGGTYPVTVTVTDDAPIPLSASDPFTLTVSTNTSPILSAIADQSVQEGEPLNVALSATDADGDGLAFSETGLPTFCSLTDNGDGSGSIACSPLGGDAGTYPVTVTVTDDAPVPASASDPFTLTVTANNPPVLTAIPNQTVVEGGSLAIALSATDPDGDTLSFTQTGMPAFCLLTDDGDGTGSIDCNPAVGDEGSYPVSVTVTDNGPVPAQATDGFVLTVGANQPPTASNVTITFTGNLTVGTGLTGNYVYADAEDDLEGTSTFRWLRDGVPIPGATADTYTVVIDDVETSLTFEVTPVAATGAATGTPVQSSGLIVSNTAPSITGQVVIEIAEEASREIVLADLTVTDLDSVFPDDFTLTVQDGVNYTRSGVNGNTITPDTDFNGDLSVPVIVNDGSLNSPVFNLVVTVTPVNDAPIITGLQTILGEPVLELTTPEDTSLTILLENLIVSDPDNVFPDDFTISAVAGANYTLSPLGPNPVSITITPGENFVGQLTVPITVSDLEPLASAEFLVPVDVSAENDLPVLDAEIGPQTAIENSLFELSVFDNFSDADGDTLTFSATGLPISGSITIDPNTGLIAGTPTVEDARDNDPYIVTVTATDPDGASASDEFELTVSALDRANIGLSIGVTPESGLPNDQLTWTFTASNPIGPAPGANVQLTGSFFGDGLAVAAGSGSSCSITVQTDRASFVCTIGALPVGSTASVNFTTTASEATEVVAFGTAAGTEPVPVDPNIANNSAVRAVGVAESFSDGAVQFLGRATIRSVAAGDLDGDGTTDLIVGTAAGQPVQVYLGDDPRASCDCQRDFVTTPLSIPDTGSNEGIAVADFDNDGDLDFVVANGGGQPDAVYRNNGGANFAIAALLAPSTARDVAVGDFNNDGFPDIAIAATSPNPVYLNDGTGGFGAGILLGDAESFDVAVGRFDGDAFDDLVFANVGSDSQVWISNGSTGFAQGAALPVGDSVAVAAADLNGDNLDDIVFGRVPGGSDDVPANPVLLNQGGGMFAGSQQLGISPTVDVLIGDVSDDGLPDLVFVNQSGVHQIWTASAGSFVLHAEQIIDIGARAGVLADLGFADANDPGGADLALGGALTAGAAVYLNDSAGNLGLGDAVAPVITLNGAAAVDVPSGTAYNDAGASAVDNIDGDVSARIVVSNPVNTAVVGAYTVTYNVRDVAGNAAVQVTRTVNVTAATGRGGGGGGSLGYGALAFLVLAHLAFLARSRKRLRCEIARQRKTAGEN